MAPGINAPWSIPRLNPAASGRALEEVADLFRTQPQPQVITTIRVRRSRRRSIFSALDRLEEAPGSGGCILRGGFVWRLDGDEGMG